MKKFALALVASAFVAGPALANNAAIDSDDNQPNLPQKVEASAGLGSTFGDVVKFSGDNPAIESDDNQRF